MKIDGGAIVNVASVHAFATMDSVPAYAASKGAIVALSRQMAIDYITDGIRVNSVVVGGVKTQMSLQHAASLGQSLDDLGFVEDRKKLGRTAQPEEIAAGITYLASEDASFVVGSAFLIDGGLTADL
jgi:NAD(P)-dependent dehydrogenase (short-subunit alcohol dehydrogenase family)